MITELSPLFCVTVCILFLPAECSADEPISQLSVVVRSQDRERWLRAVEKLAELSRQSPELRKEVWERARVNTLGMKFAAVMPGEFLSGWPASQPKPVRDAFFLSACEVTNAQMKAVLPDWQPSEYSPDPDMPAVGVDCETALRFCSTLSERENAVYRLPSGREWQYACRAGSSTAWGVETPIADHACWKVGGLQRACAVASFTPNSWGLYDMHGNALEWLGASEGEGCAAVFYGGAFAAGLPDALRCNYQIPLPLLDRFPLDREAVPFRQAIGFRVVREIRDDGVSSAEKN